MTDREGFTYEFPEMSPTERLKELIPYIAEKLKDDPAFGRVKLAKIIYFADMESFRLHRRPVTGSAWFRDNFGPLPKSFLQTLDALKAAGNITECERDYFGRTQKRIEVLSEPTFGLLTNKELDIVDRVIERFADWNASQLSHQSHGIAWRLSEGERYIPYEYSLYSDEPLTDEELKHAQFLARKYRDCDFA
ncbi:MAG: Panacea domain-containing protein [Anaerolineaceae bacterium]|nr:Panacea domain-containing protein [Anaerolineaceae bacterium]MDE0328731.1 Panacea domain-containing protein [Anaerolineaceae bacterium]